MTKLIEETIAQLEDCVKCDVHALERWVMDETAARVVLDAFAELLTADAEPIIRAVAELGSCALEPELCSYSSGPYCGAHMEYALHEHVGPARAWLANRR